MQEWKDKSYYLYLDDCITAIAELCHIVKITFQLFIIIVVTVNFAYRVQIQKEDWMLP